MPRLLSRCHVVVFSTGNTRPQAAAAFGKELGAQLQQRWVGRVFLSFLVWVGIGGVMNSGVSWRCSCGSGGWLGG